MSFYSVVVFGLGKDLLFKSVLGHCDLAYLAIFGPLPLELFNFCFQLLRLLDFNHFFFNRRINKRSGGRTAGFLFAFDPI